MKKYEFTKKVKQIGDVTLHQIKAVRAFGGIKVGDIGGWIEKEENLSHEGNAWVSGKAKVFGDAQVYGNAHISDKARVFDEARVFGNAVIFGKARVYGNSRVCGNAYIFDQAKISGITLINNNVQVFNNAEVSGDARIHGDARVCGDAQITSCDQILCVSPIGSRDDTITFFVCKYKAICVRCGCFYGDINEFAEAVQKKHGDNKYGKAYKLAIDFARNMLEV